MQVLVNMYVYPSVSVACADDAYTYVCLYRHQCGEYKLCKTSRALLVYRDLEREAGVVK